MSATILGGIVGFIGALLPDIISLIRDWIASRNGGVGTTGTNGSVVADGEDGPSGAVYELATGPEAQADIATTHPWMDALRQGVRPVITYAFFATFVYIKCAILWHTLAVGDVKAVELLPILWDEGTETLFAAIMAFWFGSRMMSKYRRRG